MDSQDSDIRKLVEDFGFRISRTLHEKDKTRHRENFRLKAQIQEQSRHIEKLEATIQEYQTRAFDSIPTDELSDATIAEQYSVIREHISNWIECFPDVVEFERNFDQILLEFNQPFRGVALEHWQVELAGGLFSAQMELFSSTVFGGLYSTIFCPYILGALEEHCTLLSRLERELDSVQGQKRKRQYFGCLKELIAEKMPTEMTTPWRKNTIKAYMSCPGYTDLVKNIRVAFLADLREFFSRLTFNEDVNMDQKLHNFQEQIMDPALKLAQDMNQSSQRYYWDWYAGFNEESPELIIYKRHLKFFTVYDIKTHNRVVRLKEDASHMQDDKIIARYLFTIYPALFRCANGQSVQIEKATVLATVLRD